MAHKVLVGTYLAQRRVRRRILWHEVMPTSTLARGNGRKRGKCGDSSYWAWRRDGGQRRYVRVWIACLTIRLGRITMGCRLKLVNGSRVMMEFGRGQIMVAIIPLGGEVIRDFHRSRRRHRICGWYLCRRPVRNGRIGRGEVRGRVRVLGSLGLCGHVVGVFAMFVLYLLRNEGKRVLGKYHKRRTYLSPIVVLLFIHVTRFQIRPPRASSIIEGEGLFRVQRPA